MSAAQPVSLPGGLSEDEVRLYMTAYLKSRQKGKPGAKARAAALRAVKAARKKAGQS